MTVARRVDMEVPFMACKSMHGVWVYTTHVAHGTATLLPRHAVLLWVLYWQTGKEGRKCLCNVCAAAAT